MTIPAASNDVTPVLTAASAVSPVQPPVIMRLAAFEPIWLPGASVAAA